MNIRSYAPAALIPLFIVVSLVTGCEKIPTQVIRVGATDTVAAATISEIDKSGITGAATFTETDGGVHVRIEIQNATAGLHAMHLHTGSCTDIGAHWHPTEVSAGTPGIPIIQATLDTPPIGIGEIGNLSVGEDGTGTLEFTTPFWSVGGDPNTDILGKLIMIHESGDTFLTNPHAHHMQTDTETKMQMEPDTPDPHIHPPGTAPHSHADTSAVVPPIQAGGGAKIGCGLIALIE